MYYYNNDTKVSSWQKPDELKTNAEVKRGGGGEKEGGKEREGRVGERRRERRERELVFSYKGGGGGLKIHTCTY